jgi:RNA polymerase sigma-70 factor (ECF subfamily)
MPRDEHETLVLEAASRNPEAVDALLERHLPALRAFIRLRSTATVRERESVSDLVQSVCREVLEAGVDFEYRGEAAFKGWLFSKALSKIQDRYRYHTAKKRDVHREVAAGDAGRGSEFAAGLGAEYGSYYAEFITPSMHAMGNEKLAQVESAFERLAEDHREIITLAKIAGLTHKEIGERLGKTEGACRSLLNRALMALSWDLARTGE